MKIADAITILQSVLDDSARLHKMAGEGRFKEAAEESRLSHLPRSGGGHYMCSERAEQRLAELAQSRINEDKSLKGRIWLRTFHDPLKKELARRGIENQEAITEKVAKEMLQVARSAALATLTTRRYCFPIFCIDEKDVDEFTLGVVHFQRTEKFLAQHQQAWDRSIEKERLKAEAETRFKADPKWPNKLRVHALTHLKKHGWIASVEIREAEPDVGWQKAESVVDLTMSGLRLLLPRRSGSFIGLADAPHEQQHSAGVSITDGEDYESRLSRSFLDPNVEQNFLSASYRVIPGFADLEQVLKKLSLWDSRSAAEDRLIAGLTWFGEAWKESRADARLVKFTICLEGLLMTGQKEGLTEQLAERLALMAEAEYAQVREYYDDARAVYAARSKIVHGESAQNYTDFRKLSRTAEDLARVGVLGFACLCPLLPPTGDLNKMLSEFFTARKLGGPEEARNAIHSINARHRTGQITET
jgi:hypothetical protein